MILSWPVHILHVTANRARSDRSKPFDMIQKPKIFLNLDMTHVVPVTDVGRGDFIEQLRDFALRWNFFISTTPSIPSRTFFLKTRLTIGLRHSLTRARCESAGRSGVCTASVFFL